MDILIIGGSRFVGRHMVAAALARNHRVTTFNRGKSGTDDDRVEALHGDRDGGLDALVGRRWDAVIDTCGYVPRVVRQSAALLREAQTYAFVSSLSVYADFEPDQDERAPLATMEDETSEDIAAHYGALKVLCERAIEAEMPGRGLYLRAGLIVGPLDYMNRFPYWLRRLTDGGDVLAPGEPDSPVQFIDARDLAEWTIIQCERRTSGAFNLTGPEQPLRFADALTTLRSALDSDARFTWVDDAFLAAHRITPLDGIPLWLPSELDGFFRRRIDRALDQGLTFRPLADTARDTWAWLQAQPDPAGQSAAGPIVSGLSREDEARLLAEWREKAGAAGR